MRYKIYRDHFDRFLPMKREAWLDWGDNWDCFYDWDGGPIVSFASLLGATLFIQEQKEKIKQRKAQNKADRADEKSRTYYL